MEPGTIIGGRFVIERRAASGGMGSVFHARDELDGRAVALKLLHSVDALDGERFDRESRILATLDHPGVVRYIAHGTTSAGERYLAMEWLQGEDLAARLTRLPLSAQESLLLIRQVAEALAYAHERGIIHRDIKPPNIFLVGGEVRRLKILDFGIARRDRETSALTYTGGILGTPGYMSPEQLQGQVGLSPDVDVYSLGCVAFECLTGKRAFEGAHLMAALAKVLFQEPPRLRDHRPDAPDALADLIARMIAKKASERPRDGAAIRVELDRIQDVLSAWAVSPADITLNSPRSLPPSSLQDHAALTMREQRLVSLVLAGDVDAGAATPSSERIHALEDDEIRSMVTSCGATLVELGPSSLVAVVSGPGSAVDRAERAAQCALALSARFTQLPVCVTTGRGIASAELIEGAVIDRGVRALRQTLPGAVRLDDVTAAMLTSRFKVKRDEEGAYLTGETSFDDEVPLLLGKPSPWVGRSRELRTLEGVFAGCVQESLASAVLVVGPPGSGKSRLCREFLSRAKKETERVLVLLGRAGSVAAGSPYGMIADAIRRAAGIRDDDPLDVRRQKLRARVARHVDAQRLPTVAGFLGELCGAPFPEQEARGLRAARADAMVMNDATRAAWEDWLLAECSAQPVLLVLEDLHWGDAATVRLVGTTLRNLHDQPLMLLVLARPEVHTQFPGLWSDRDVQLIKLGPLPAKASAELVRGVLGPAFAAEDVARIVERADGNPFYLEEIIRAAFAGKQDALPDSILGTVEARLDAEGAEAKRVLRAASVFGERFSRLGVVSLLGGEARISEIDGTLQALSSRELIAPSQGATTLVTDYTFRHSIVREACYATLTENDRELGHRLAGDWLERTGHSDAMALAEHFRRGATPERARRWYHKASQQALDANDLAAALDRAARAIEAGASGEELGALRLIEAEAHAWRGELVDGQQRADEAIALLPVGSAAWFRALLQASHLAGRRGLTDRVLEIAALASAEVSGAEAWRAQMICLCCCGNYLVLGGLYGVAEELLAKLDKAATGRPSLDPEVVAVLHELRAFCASAAGDPGECLIHLRAAAASFEQAGDLRNAVMSNTNVGSILTELGDFEGAEETLRSALSAASRLGLDDATAAVLHNLGHALLHRDNLEEARATEQKALAAFHAQGAARHEGVARYYVAKIALASGDLEGAHREAFAAVDLLVAAPPLRPAAEAILSRVLVAQGQTDEGLRVAHSAYSKLEELGSVEEGEATVRLAYAEALRAAGRMEEAGFVLQAARKALLERAGKISDATFRERFLSRVPDNARTLVLAPSDVPPAIPESGEVGEEPPPHAAAS